MRQGPPSGSFGATLAIRCHPERVNDTKHGIANHHEGSLCCNEMLHWHLDVARVGRSTRSRRSRDMALEHTNG